MMYVGGGCRYRGVTVCVNACMCGRVNSVECECRKCRCKQQTSSTTTTTWQPVAVCVRVLRCDAALIYACSPPPQAIKLAKNTLSCTATIIHLVMTSKNLIFATATATKTAANTATAVYSFDAQLHSQQRHSNSSSSSSTNNNNFITTTCNDALKQEKKSITNRVITLLHFN